MGCGTCKTGKTVYGGQIECVNVESEFCGIYRDSDDICNLFRNKKIMREKKVIEPVLIDQHIPNPVLPVRVEKVKEIKPKKDKNYKQKSYAKLFNLKKNGTTIYLITQNNHIAGFGDAKDGGKKHVYFHEELLAKEYCQKNDKTKNKKYKYGYIECIIYGEPKHWYEDNQICQKH